ncbi:MAG: polysaccharide deacetylase family protein, partial [Bacillota bacterium]|nr:polysaccharide deacetylase family protein [Bacillota bacterium]
GKRILILAAAVTSILVAICLSVGDTAKVSGEVRGTPYYEGEKGHKAVSFAMNVDWGTEYLPDILSVLKEEGVTMTFNLTGRWCSENPEIAKAIYQSGMEIGNHGLKHKSPSAMTYEENKADIEEAEAIINQVLGIKTMLFAPASGEIEAQVLNAAADLGYKTILWSVDTIDWQKPTPELITERVVGKAKDGSIVLMHPTENTLAALPGMIQALRDKELSVVPVSQIIDKKIE